jgi:hypothetical protein
MKIEPIRGKIRKVLMKDPGLNDTRSSCPQYQSSNPSISTASRPSSVFIPRGMKLLLPQVASIMVAVATMVGPSLLRVLALAFGLSSRMVGKFWYHLPASVSVVSTSATSKTTSDAASPGTPRQEGTDGPCPPGVQLTESFLLGKYLGAIP